MDFAVAGFILRLSLRAGTRPNDFVVANQFEQWPASTVW
eukprot:SAG31_NODE_22045_length_535_cov_0.832569_1_plen_38_part_10